MPNVELLRETLDHVIAMDAEHAWNQHVWLARRGGPLAYEVPEGNTCGTAACFAGWRAVLDEKEGLCEIPKRAMDIVVVQIETPQGPREVSLDIAEYAQQRLGLDDEEAEELFNSENSLRTLKDLVDRFCEVSS